MLQRPLRTTCAAKLTALGLGFGLLGCSQARRDAVPPDCTVQDQFELETVAGFSPNRWYGVPDGSLQQGVVRSIATATPGVPDPVLCDFTQQIKYQASGNHDWGSFIGVYHEAADVTTGVVPPLAGGDATGFEGLSFWARSVYDKGLTIELTDNMSDDEAGLCEPSAYRVDDAGAVVTTGGTRVANPNFSDENGVPKANACGNAFDALLLPTERWAFYTIPFKSFRQTRQDPSLKPNGLDLANIWRVLIRSPRGSIVEASFVNFAWYRKAPAN